VETEMAGRLAESAKGTSVRALRAALAKMRKATFDNPDAFARADTAFHLAIVEGVGHGLFATILKPLAPLAHQYGLETYDSKSTLDCVIREHRAILRHIEAGNAEGARSAMAHHLTSSRSHYTELLGRRATSSRPPPSLRVATAPHHGR
jgi:GntR family transcriptional repressor for pyruvate dehydrogenase complex